MAASPPVGAAHGRDPLIHNRPVLELNHPIRELQKLRSVRDQYDTHCVFQVAQSTHEFGLGVCIQRGRWFVEHENAGFAQQRPGNADALPFTTSDR